MIDLYLSVGTDRGTCLRKSLEGSLAGLKVSGSVLEGRASVERVRFSGDMEGLQDRLREERYQSELDYDAVLRGHQGRR